MATRSGIIFTHLLVHVINSQRGGKSGYDLPDFPWCKEIPKFTNSLQGNRRKNQDFCADLLRDIIQEFLSCRIIISLWWWLLLIKFPFHWTSQSCPCMHLFNSDLLRQHIRITKFCKATVGNSYTNVHMGEKKPRTLFHSSDFEGST